VARSQLTALATNSCQLIDNTGQTNAKFNTHTLPGVMFTFCLKSTTRSVHFTAPSIPPMAKEFSNFRNYSTAILHETKYLITAFLQFSPCYDILLLGLLLWGLSKTSVIMDHKTWSTRIRLHDYFFSFILFHPLLRLIRNQILVC
jgi:hypothetical protein